MKSPISLICILRSQQQNAFRQPQGYLCQIKPRTQDINHNPINRKSKLLKADKKEEEALAKNLHIPCQSQLPQEPYSNQH